MTLTGTYTYSPTIDDLKEQDTGWLPKCIDGKMKVERVIGGEVFMTVVTLRIVWSA